MEGDSQQTRQMSGEWVSGPIVKLASLIVVAVLLFVGGSVVSHGNRIYGLEQTTSDRERDRDNWRRAEKQSSIKWKKFGEMLEKIHTMDIRLSRQEGFQDGWRSRGEAIKQEGGPYNE